MSEADAEAALAELIAELGADELERLRRLLEDPQLEAPPDYAALSKSALRVLDVLELKAGRR